MSTNEYSCKLCGRCCHQDIPVTIYDLHRIAVGLGIHDGQAFNKCVGVKVAPKVNIFSMKKKADGSCVFLEEDNHCSIHSFKPRICSFFPCPDIKKENKNLWEKLYLSSSTYEIFWEHSMAENHTKKYIQHYGTDWNEDGYFEILDGLKHCIISEDGEELVVASDRNGLPIIMKYNCLTCKVKECRLQTEITLIDILRISENTHKTVQYVFKSAVSKRLHSYTGGLKMKKTGGGIRCVYFSKNKQGHEHCKIFEFRPRFCDFSPCRIRIGDEETWKRFFFATGSIDEHWELEAASVISREYANNVGTKYNKTEFEKHVEKINVLLNDDELKDTFVINIREYRYDEIPIQPAL